MNIFGSKNFGVLEKSLDSLSKQHKIISNNIANSDTPGYKRKYVTFKKELSKVLEGKGDLEVTNKRHISINGRELSSFNSKIHTERMTTVRNDGNNVSVDAEMANLAENTLEYQTVAKQLSNQFKRLESVIKEGGN